MYKIIIVDDEPIIVKGLASLLGELGLTIDTPITASNAYEALDYIKAEDIDLLITDIKMDSINGIELMQQAKMIKPWIQTIVISAYEDFHFAQLALKLGARDYLLKPLNSEEFLNVVRDILLKINKDDHFFKEKILKLHHDFMMKEPLPMSTHLLNYLLNTNQDEESIRDELKTLYDQYGVNVAGPYFSIFKIKLLFNEENGWENDNEINIYHYAALNIVYETLKQECNHVSIYSPNNRISTILQWDEAEYRNINKIGHLEMIGRLLEFNIQKHLNINCLIGISQILKGIKFLFLLNKQAEKMVDFTFEENYNHVFYYGDFYWNLNDPSAPSNDAMIENNSIVNKVQGYILENYHKKGLTLYEIAQNNHVSPNYLSYLFKKHTSQNIWEFVIKLRMEESKRLLLNTDCRRYEIAERVGYESPEHFSKIFKKYFGKSLSEMRK